MDKQKRNEYMREYYQSHKKQIQAQRKRVKQPEPGVEKDFEQMNDREKLYFNAKAIAKMNGIRIDNLEHSCGMSNGYLSRVAKSGKGLDIIKIHMIADFLGVTIDDLITKNYWEEYKSRIAEMEITEAVRKAKKAMRGCDVLEVVNRLLEEQ